MTSATTTRRQTKRGRRKQGGFGRERNRELVLLIIAGALVTAASATVWLAQSEIASAWSLAWGASFFALILAGHLGIRRLTPNADPIIFPAAAALCGIGVTLITRLDTDYASRQTGWLFVSVFAMLALLALLPDHRELARYKYIIGATSVLALIITVSPLGEEVRGARLWISLGPINIQPGEFAKIGIVIFLAAYLRENRELLAGKVALKHLGPLLLVWGASLAMLVLMNDFGASLLFFGTFLLITYVATGRAWYVAAGAVAFVAGASFVYQTANHVRSRFDIWLDPWKDEQGAGYQLVQGLYAFADGGLFGRGLGQAYVVTDSGSTLIPDAHTDFIFAVISDELGFIGAVGVILLYVTITWRGFSIAARATDGFSSLLAFGLTTAFALQTIIILGGLVRMLPLTGQTLPFVSYGGSSVLANFVMLGLLLTISHRTRSQRIADAANAAGYRP